MKVYRLTRVSLPKIAVLATGLAAAVMAFNLSPQAAQATPNMAQNCANCHNGSTSTATTATPSTGTPVVGATYTVAITLEPNPTGGNSGYAIVPVSPDTQETNGGNTGPLLSYTATMTAPAALGTYTYTVYTNQGSQATGQTGSAVYSITVAAASITTATTPPTTTIPATTPPLSTTTATTPPVTSTNPTLITAPSALSVVGLPNVHGPYAMNTGKCALCHRAHVAQASNLIKNPQRAPGSQSALCFTCHDGTGASTNVQAEYPVGVPANNPATGAFYSHDAVAGTPPIAHTESRLDEFGVATNGFVINRHSECSDCHNPHQATASTTRNSVETVTGWTASGRLAGVSGVSVANGTAANSTPTYTFLSGADTNVVPANLVTREYQLCFKCHSGFTTLTSNTGLKPSQYALDKAVEFNPANPSFHPIEAKGTNQTAKMDLSLSVDSTYRLFKNLTSRSTIRCVNCHTSSSTPNVPLLPLPGSALQPHTSSNRGILIRNYQDRVLKSTGAAYSADDFALCYACHAVQPFGPGGTNAATNFKEHAFHLTELANKSTGGTGGIDTPGAGQGNAICAECHFRLHSTTNKVVGQTIPGSRLVNFAPNVTANGTLSWTTGSTGSGSCTLTCHGYRHSGKSYGP